MSHSKLILKGQVVEFKPVEGAGLDQSAYPVDVYFGDDKAFTIQYSDVEELIASIRSIFDKALDRL